jgi:solute carrier family 25 oxoglutarate transporter 11
MTSHPSTNTHNVVNTLKNFGLGGFSGAFATVCIQPMDMIKVRIQLQGEGTHSKTGVSTNPLAVARSIVAKDGFAALYTGLSAGILRQLTYTTTRLGIFRTITDSIDAKRKRTFLDTTLASLVAGGIGSIVGTPADLALIRMQADGTLPPEQRRNYTGVFNALGRIIKEEGFIHMFRGCTPVVVRAMALNVGMLASHDTALEHFKTLTDSYVLYHIGAKSVSGFFAAAFSLPFDFVKTRIQKQKPLPDGTMPYKNSIDCVVKVLRSEGPGAFYRGFSTYYLRIAPHVMITLFTLDALKSIMKV